MVTAFSGQNLPKVASEMEITWEEWKMLFVQICFCFKCVISNNLLTWYSRFQISHYLSICCLTEGPISTQKISLINYCQRDFIEIFWTIRSLRKQRTISASMTFRSQRNSPHYPQANIALQHKRETNCYSKSFIPSSLLLNMYREILISNSCLFQRLC